MKRTIHTFHKAISKLRTAVRLKRKDKDSPAWDAEIAHYRKAALTFAQTASERKLAETI